MSVSTCRRPGRIAGPPVLCLRRDYALQHIWQIVFVLFHLVFEVRQFFLCAGDLSAYLLWRGAAVGVAAFHGAARREQREEVFVYFGDDGLSFGERELVHRTVVLYAPADGVADFFVRVAEGHAAKHEVFRNVGREDEAVGEAAVRLFFVDFDVREERRQYGEDELEAVERAEEAAFVVLQVAVVCERDAFHHCEEVYERAGELARLAAQQFEHVGVLFLRHDAGTCAK